jgi:hypothetical protein
VGGGTEAGQGGEVGVDDLKKKRFLWGMLLAWAPLIPALIGLANLFRGISGQKATGLGALDGGLAELFVLYGMVAILVGQVAAIILLFRSFSPGHWGRGFLSLLAICFSGLMLLLVGLFFWLCCSQIHHNF